MTRAIAPLPALRCSTFSNENDKEVEYMMSSCSVQGGKIGRLRQNFTLESIDGSHSLKLQSILECNSIPNVRQDIPTPTVARNYRHLRDLERMIPEEDTTAEISLLIGRDIIAAHNVLDQRIGDDHEPCAQKLRLGWVIIGETCLGAVHQPEMVTVNKKNVLRCGRETCFTPCPNDLNFKIKDTLGDKTLNISEDIFSHSKDDETIGLSQEDQKFIDIMEDGFFMSPEGKWSAPLPFRQGRIRLDNNRMQAVQRTETLPERYPIKQEKFCSFMEDMFTKGHAEIAPPIQEGEECRYLPIFPVYHPQKPGKVRVVFDSSAKVNGHSLNDVLMTGPDVTNNLVGVLLKFRKEKIAITADIEQMFFNFQVHEQHRNCLKFLWFEENDPTKNLVDYRMRVHVFGNSPSPAVATMGLRKSACNHGNDESFDQVCDFVRNHFYVDDGLKSFSDEKTAVELMLKTQKRLKENGNLRLHKLSSNSAEVLSCFPRDDLAKELSETDFFDSNTADVQRSFGLSWELKSDTFL
ncbi:uncharacterized protein [Argopecten irradians]|uniref:uncharacterized protein n=1 Tax=Argopecten irradians TaxID=31199 RepID=UPI003719DDB0